MGHILRASRMKTKLRKHTNISLRCQIPSTHNIDQWAQGRFVEPPALPMPESGVHSPYPIECPKTRHCGESAIRFSFRQINTTQTSGGFDFGVSIRNRIRTGGKVVRFSIANKCAHCSHSSSIPLVERFLFFSGDGIVFFRCY